VGVGRSRELSAVVASLLARAAAEKGRASGEVRSAVPLNDDQKQRLVSAVEKATGKQVELKYVVDPSVLGGIVTQVGDTVIDGTVRTRLEQLRETL
jgi:F-type H+-transporting ATPase subunit delta